MLNQLFNSRQPLSQDPYTELECWNIDLAFFFFSISQGLLPYEHNNVNSVEVVDKKAYYFWEISSIPFLAAALLLSKETITCPAV